MEKKMWKTPGVETSFLGYGCRQFPLTEDGSIDEEKAQILVDTAIAGGVNYFDNGYLYNKGQSEVVLGKALEKYDRDSYYLATKLPVWVVETKEDAESIFEKQLERLKTDHIDFYLLHSMNRSNWDKVLELDILSFLQEKKAEGKIGYIGFSFHDCYEMFEEVLNGFAWDFCQMQLSYLLADGANGVKGCELANKLQIPVIVMEPLGAGKLGKCSEEVADKFKALNEEASPASYALRWAGSLPDVKMVLVGVTAKEHLEENLKTFEEFKPVTKEEQDVINEVVTILKNQE